MNAKDLRTTVCFAIIMATLQVHGEQASSAGGDGVCAENAYALCSHAECQCYDSSGEPGDCELYVGEADPDRGWAECKCPVVSLDPEGDLLYRANYGLLPCEERETPSKTGLFPSYAESQDTIADVYSEYSFGDALEGEAYGTDSKAQVLVCTDQTMMTLCLDMPCTLGDSGEASCYCQNVAIPDPPATFVTFGGHCYTAHCDPDIDSHIWSAALMSQIVAGNKALTDYIRNVDEDFESPVQYCSPARR